MVVGASGTQINTFTLPGNLHKWAFSARGTAIQWVRPDHHGIVFPAVTSFDYPKSFPINHFSQGTRNDAPYVVAGDALDFYQWIGGLVSVKKTLMCCDIRWLYFFI